jgi:putative addiction module component (TIGR02574 family)
MAVDVGRTIDDLRSLSVEDRMRVVQVVWDTFPEQAAAPTSAEQAAELKRRLDAYEAAPEDLLTWDEVLERLRSILSVFDRKSPTTLQRRVVGTRDAAPV